MAVIDSVGTEHLVEALDSSSNTRHVYTSVLEDEEHNTDLA